MDNNNLSPNPRLNTEFKSIKDYILLIRNNLFAFFTIASIITVIVIAYAVFAKNIYKSTVILKVKNQNNNVLQSSDVNRGNDRVNDRSVANEVEVFNKYDSREIYAKALVDSFVNSKNKNLFVLLKADGNEGINGHKSVFEITDMLKNVLTVNQEPNTDLIDISAESPSPYEAALIANTCAELYKKIDLERNRAQLKDIASFLKKQRNEKLAELTAAEDSLKNFQQKGGIVALDDQSKVLIDQLAQLDAQKDAAKIDLMSSDESLQQYKNEIKNQDPRLVSYLESQTSQAYIEVLQKQIAELQMNRDLALAYKNSNVNITQKVKDYNTRITELQNKLKKLIGNIKSNAYASSPDQIKDLTQKMIEEQVKKHSLSIKLKELQAIIDQYERKFERLPKASIELARYKRNRDALQELYLLVEKNYQSAEINELSQPGNIIIMGKSRIPDKPEKPNRPRVILIGIVAGLFLGFIFLLVKDYFDDTIKTPEDINKNNINTLAWIPNYKNKNNGQSEIIVKEDSASAASEAFRSIRARLQFSMVDAGSLKKILITSPAEKEGKTFVAVNLAESFGQANKKTLLIDCDIRRPRVHTVLKVNKIPGIVDYLFRKAKLEDIINSNSKLSFDYITSGTIPLNPAEVLGSKAMRIFLEQIKKEYDVIIMDSAPVVSVIDTEILARIADGTIMVISAEETEKRLMKDALGILKEDKAKILGTVLNNFKYRNGYGYYYKYYYNYSSSSNKNKKRLEKSNEVSLN